MGKEWRTEKRVAPDEGRRAVRGTGGGQNKKPSRVREKRKSAQRKIVSRQELREERVRSEKAQESRHAAGRDQDAAAECVERGGKPE